MAAYAAAVVFGLRVVVEQVVRYRCLDYCHSSRVA